MTNKTTEALKLADKVISRYRNETPIGNQPHMICHIADEALSAIREALAEPVKQEPVGEVDLHKELGQLRWMGGDEGWDNAIHAVRKRLEELYAAPVDAKAIRAEALEEAAKVCEQGTGDAVQTDVLKALWKERERIAEVIRGLK